MRIRPMEPGDVVAARDVAVGSIAVPDHADGEQRRRFSAARLGRLARTDPGGCWVAEDAAGAVAGVAAALVRDGIWGLSYLAVRPDVQERGVGRGLLEAALGHAGGARGALVASSVDPRAMRLYALAGFDLKPCVAAAGIVDRRRSRRGCGRAPAGATRSSWPRGSAADPRRGLRPRRPGAPARRAATSSCGPATTGVAIHSGGTAHLLVARDERRRADLLWSVLAASPERRDGRDDVRHRRPGLGVRAGLRARPRALADAPDVRPRRARPAAAVAAERGVPLVPPAVQPGRSAARRSRTAPPPRAATRPISHALAPSPISRAPPSSGARPG
jgi:GNAT superfamily N-acetyltransferase